MNTLLAALILATGPKPPAGLSEYVGRDLTKLTEAQTAQLARKLDTLYKEPKSEDAWFPLTSTWVRQYRAGAIEWLYLQIYPGYNVPDMSFARAYAFDSNWKFVKRYEFPTGYRLRFAEQKLSVDPWISQPVLQITVSSVGPFIVTEGQKAKPLFHPESGIVQTYAFSESGVTLIRMENGAGELLTNSYEWEIPAIGPNVSRRTADEWRKELLSADPVRRLGFLVWMAGSHLNSKMVREKGVSREPAAESLAYEALRKDRAVITAIEDLAESRNPWLKRQAGFTLRQMDKPLQPVED